MLTTRTWIHAVGLLSCLFAAGCSDSRHSRSQVEAQNEEPSQTQTYSVTATADSGGSITPTVVSVNPGESTVLTVTPNSGFRIANVTGCDGTLAGNAYTTGLINADCAVAASFASNTVTVTGSAGTGGSITPSNISITQGASTLFTVTANPGFRIASVTGCGGSLAGNAYTTGLVNADCAVAASFAANIVTVTASAGAGGSITPDSVSIVQGTSTRLTVTANLGFRVASVTGCGGSLAGNVYTTGLINTDCAVTASFAASTFTVTANASAGGNISPASVSVAEGARTVLTMTPNSGFSIASVTASGCSGTLAGTAYTTSPITANCTVTVNFAITAITFTVTASAGVGGHITPASVSVIEGVSTLLTVTPDSGFSITSVTPTGCTGTLAGNVYTTDPITANCAVAASFTASTFTVTANASAGGNITPASVSVTQGGSALLTVTPDTGFVITNVTPSGCSGILAGTVYTTGPITGDCTVTANFALAVTSARALYIAAGGYHTCALTSAGLVQCWGSNGFGELGNGNTTNSITPVTVTGLSGPITALAAGAQHTCALTNTGSVQCWGYNPYGQLGNGGTVNSSIPVTVTGLSGQATAVVAGGYHNCALTSAGAVQCWGYNVNGQLGNGSTVKSTTPVTVTGLSESATALAAGTNHSCALTSLGAMQCWGINTNGQLGDGTVATAVIPVTVSGLNGSATTLATGAQHTCALTSLGAVQCWGNNANGQLGNGTLISSRNPVTVTTLSGAATVLVAGANHACALTNAGTIQCWGFNNYGQLGNGTTVISTTPVAVTGLSGAATALSAGYGHNCALTSAGAAQCWGYNLYGQLGNGSTKNSADPVAVTGLSGP